MSRMMACLGQPTLTVQPIRYVSDNVTKDGEKEVLRYPLKVVLWESLRFPTGPKQHQLNKGPPHGNQENDEGHPG